MRCVVLDDYQQVATSYADWSALDLPDDPLDLVCVPRHLEDEDVVGALAGAQIVVVMRERTPITRALLERLPDLRLLVTTGRRNASIDLAACAERGIVVCGTGSSSAPPAELTWALLLALARHLPTEADALVHGGAWQSTVGIDLEGSRLGLIGLGRIGQRVAAVGRAFGMQVVAWSPHLDHERARAGGAELSSLDELLATSDVVSLHLVLSETTRGLLGEAELARMKPTAYVVNTSRSGLIDSAALLAALDAGTIAGAGLDVFDTEPLPTDDPMRVHPRVVGTPHLGYVTAANYRTFFTEAVEDVLAWRSGHPVRTL